MGCTPDRRSASVATSVVQCQIGRVNWRSPVPSSELDPSFYQGLIRFVLHEAVFKHAKRRQDFLWKFTLPSSERKKVLNLLDSQNLNALEARGRWIASNGVAVFQRRVILFTFFQRTPLRMKNGRKSSRSFKDASDFLRTIAPYQQVTSIDANFFGSRAVEVSLSI